MSPEGTPRAWGAGEAEAAEATGEAKRRGTWASDQATTERGFP